MLLKKHIIKKTASIGRRSLLSSCAAFAVLWPFSLKAAGRASSIRLGKHGNITRFVMDISEKVEYRIIPLVNPFRLVVDISAVSFDFPDKKPEITSGLVKNVRFGKGSDKKSRIVLDLEKPAKIRKSFILSPQSGFDWRFVIDLEETSIDDFLNNAGVKSDSKEAIPLMPAKRKPEIKSMVNAPIPEEKPEPPKEKRKPIIVLDPGHGGRDPGAVGVSGVYEKNITLKMAKELKKRLVNTGRYEVVLTRNRDVSMSLRGRVRRARAVKGDVFVSLHADSIKKRSVRGLSVYTLSEKSSDAEAAALAERENKADIIAGIDFDGESKEVTSILIDLAQRETLNLSAKFAEVMVKKMVKTVKLLRNTHRFAGFAVLKAPDIPSVLLEMGYLSNRYEEKLLKQASYRAKLASAVVQSLDDYFNNVDKLV